ncbi:hypothetical protein [Roseibium sp. Sym1]|uniref:hypothetical protein n=1 Tax=Roseibium sp. Sym1 TaxID=3016006 RepID=UPI0022B5854E|nr:hypothetical protein [Roseibium sp. Sym1]
MKTPGATAPVSKKPVTTSTMKRVGPPRPRKTPQLVSPSDNTEALIEALRERVNDLESRISELESMISLQNQDVIISAPKSVLIQGQDTVELSASSKLIMSAAVCETNAPTAKFSTILQCDILQANTVIGATYTPAAGNIW